jgi:hypothetical protein
MSKDHRRRAADEEADLPERSGPQSLVERRVVDRGDY